MTIWVTTNLQHVGYPLKFRRCNNGTAMQLHRPCWTGTKGKVTTSLDESLLWTKPGLAHTNQAWNVSQMNGSNLGLLIQRKLPYTMCCEDDVHCGVWHCWVNTAPCCTSKADCKRYLLLHIPAAPLLSSAQEKAILGATGPHNSLWQCKESHRCCCLGLLAPW